MQVSPLRDERGQVLVFGALVLGLLLAAFALFGLGAADAFNARSQLQSAADAATLAATKTAEPVLTLQTHAAQQSWDQWAECTVYAKGGGCEQWVWWWEPSRDQPQLDLGQVTISDTAANLFDNGSSQDPGWAQETCSQLNFTGTCGSFSGNGGQAPAPGFAMVGQWFPGSGPAPCDNACDFNPDVSTTVGVSDWTRVGAVYWVYPTNPYPVVRHYLDANFQPAGSATITSFSYAGCDPKQPTSTCTGTVTATVHVQLLSNVAGSGVGAGAFSSSRPKPGAFPQSGS